ncbi:hypothetical protein L207DRAFT_584870 [Hyaloscypha variabilis F]|uniref:Uncharacterized protein n=1 Tax=Hyaloscypha variabilis (strain UAMH 11265 / GT02V1 / F) TaxID=1149755 RepID=A0A2J6RHJ0_HYAVF|nr:hypothetical protein L207DRAFT_584870 [Hyaloscypha variabilis F]
MVLVLSGWTVGTIYIHIEDLPKSLGKLYRNENQEDSAELWDAFEVIIDCIRASYGVIFDIDSLLSHTLLADSELPTPKSKDEGIDVKAFREAMILNFKEEQSSSNMDLAREWLYHDLTHYWSLWLTEDKLLCLAPIDTRERDIATVLLGGRSVMARFCILVTLTSMSSWMDKRSTILTQKKLFESLKLFDSEKLEQARTPGRSKSSVCYWRRGYRRRMLGVQGILGGRLQPID